MSYTIPVAAALAAELEDSLNAGPMIDDLGRRMLNEEELARFNGVSVQIYADEHPPPHFHVRHAGANVSFAIDSGRRLPGMKGLDGFDRNVAKWWRDHRCDLILAWNRLRPSDCLVGPVAVPPECAQGKRETAGD